MKGKNTFIITVIQHIEVGNILNFVLIFYFGKLNIISLYLSNLKYLINCTSMNHECVIKRIIN